MDARSTQDRIGLGALGPKGVYNKENRQVVQAAESLAGFGDIIKALDGMASGLKNVNFSTPKMGGISGGKVGGGGGGKGAASEKEVSQAKQMVDLLEKMLNLMNQLDAIRNFERELTQLNATYYKNRGELTNYIAAMRDEMAILERNNAAETENARSLEKQMDAKKAEIASLQSGTEEYDFANEALAKLQTQHQKYSKSLLQNKIDMDALTEAMKEQERQIRQMHIDVENLIERAIRDREELYESMLQAEIRMENEILAILKKRYEAERDLILKNIDERIKALQAEKKAIDDNLRKRREEDDWAKKQTRLLELQEQYARISADPTRQREALAIHEEMTKLREDMAWTLAEKEAQAQKDGIDEQIRSLQDYIDYVKKHYEDLFKYPEQLIAEMQHIMQMTDDEIMQWLQQNSEEYAMSSARTQENMRRTWETTLMDMRGQVRTYWDEVNWIMAQGQDYIINFMMQNSASYRQAGAMQAQAYVDEWRRQLDALQAAARNTYQAVQSYSYQPTYTNTYVPPASSGGSSGGGSSGGGGSSARYKFVVLGKTYGPYSSIAAAEKAKQAEIDKIKKGATTGSSMYGQAISAFQTATIVRYAKGGLVDYTGLAMVHGSQKEPEAFLSADQTRMIKGFVEALQKIATVKVPSMPHIGSPAVGEGPYALTFGDIIVRVEKLDTERDLEELAEKMKQAIATTLKNGKAVGGMFFGR